MIRNRGKLTTEVVYDIQPIADYFRKVSSYVLGMIEMQGKIQAFFFEAGKLKHTDMPVTLRH